MTLSELIGAPQNERTCAAMWQHSAKERNALLLSFASDADLTARQVEVAHAN